MTIVRNWDGRGLASQNLTTSTAGLSDEHFDVVLPFNSVAGNLAVIALSSIRFTFNPTGTGMGGGIAWNNLNLVAPTGNWAVRFYFTVLATPTLSQSLLHFVDTSGGLFDTGIIVTSGVAKVAGATIVANTEYRVEVVSTTSSATATVYLGDTMTTAGTPISMGTGKALSSISFGNASASSTSAYESMNIRNIAFSDTAAAIGPYVAPTPPTVNAGTDQSVIVPNPTNLTAVVTPGTSNTYTVLWTQTAGTTVGFGASTSLFTGVGPFTSAGNYTFQVAITDSNGFVATDSVNVFTSTAPVPPSVGMPSPSVAFVSATKTLLATVVAGTGTIVSYLWQQVSTTTGNPTTASPTINNANTAVATTNPFMTTGLRRYKLTVTDSNGLTATGTMDVTGQTAAPPSIIIHDNSAVTAKWIASSDTHPLSVVVTPGDLPILTKAWHFSSGTTITGDTDASTWNVNGDTVGPFNFGSSATIATFTISYTVTTSAGTTTSNILSIPFSIARVSASTFFDPLYKSLDTVTIPGKAIAVINANVDTKLGYTVGASSDGTVSTFDVVKLSGPDTEISDVTYNSGTRTASRTLSAPVASGDYEFSGIVTTSYGAHFTSDPMSPTVIIYRFVFPNPPVIDTEPNLVLPNTGIGANLGATIFKNLGDFTDTDIIVTQTAGPTVEFDVVKTRNNLNDDGSNYNYAVRVDVTNFSSVATYAFEFSVTDDWGATNSAIQYASVGGAPRPPAATLEGDDVFINNSTHLFATLHPGTGTIEGTEWSQVANGSPDVTINTPGALDTTVGPFDTAGNYLFEFNITDSNNLMFNGLITITIYPIASGDYLDYVSNVQVRSLALLKILDIEQEKWYSPEQLLKEYYVEKLTGLDNLAYMSYEQVEREYNKAIVRGTITP